MLLACEFKTTPLVRFFVLAIAHSNNLFVMFRNSFRNNCSRLSDCSTNFITPAFPDSVAITTIRLFHIRRFSSKNMIHNSFQVLNEQRSKLWQGSDARQTYICYFTTIWKQFNLCRIRQITWANEYKARPLDGASSLGVYAILPLVVINTSAAASASSWRIYTRPHSTFCSSGGDGGGGTASG
ncbi:unnamed protein product [Trichogramma brassicae]|uniref:Uncharacterized protein n=1 Tax=Trichogramma brassicae TaxID=86971 RepID=A0A6H5IQY7_9HYME|nr:unnamed protein product [Trichogramma brassicae]